MLNISETKVPMARRLMKSSMTSRDSMTSHSWRQNLQSCRIRKLGDGSTIRVGSVCVPLVCFSHFVRYQKQESPAVADKPERRESMPKHKNCSDSTSLQRCRWQYWPIFIRLAVVASEICEIPRNSLKIQTYRVQGHPRSSILVSIESPCDFILVINCNFGRICYRFWDIHG